MAGAGTLTPEPVLEATRAWMSPVVRESGDRRRALFAVAGLIIGAGAAARVAALSSSIWFDESVSIRDVSGSFSQMLHRVVNHEASPPVYFICLWLWRHLFGDSAMALRSLSALCGTLTMCLAFSVARRRLGDRGALILTALVAASPALIYYSADMRMYGVLVLLVGCGFEAFLRASETPSRRHLTVWALASLLALWTQYYAVLAVAPQAALLLWGARRPQGGDRRTLAGVAAVAVGGLPLLYLMPYQAHRAWAYGQTLVSSPWHQIGLSIHYPSTAWSVSEDLIAGPSAAARAPLTILGLLVGVAAIALAIRAARPHRGRLARAVWLIAPALLAIELLLSQSVLLEGRYLLVLWLPVGLAVGYGLAGASPRLGVGLAAVLVLAWTVIGGVALAVPRFATQDDIRGAAQSLGVARAGRLIAINQPWDVLSLQQYRPQSQVQRRRVAAVREVDVIAMPPGGEPFPGSHARPTSVEVGVLPRGFRLAGVTRGASYLIERFVAASPLPVEVDGRGRAFTGGNWRFLSEPAGAGMGSL
jgi:mannosyltransferase